MKKIILILMLLNSPILLRGQNAYSEQNNETKIAVSRKNNQSEPCFLSVNEMPFLNGLRLGMTYEEVAGIFPEIRENEYFQNTFVEKKSGLFISKIKETSGNSLNQNLIEVSLHFQNNEIVIMSFIYSSPEWSSISKAVNYLSNNFGVAENQWKIKYYRNSELNCKDFNVYAYYSYPESSSFGTFSIHKIMNIEN